MIQHTIKSEALIEAFPRARPQVRDLLLSPRMMVRTNRVKLGTGFKGAGDMQGNAWGMSHISLFPLGEKKGFKRLNLLLHVQMCFVVLCFLHSSPSRSSQPCPQMRPWPSMDLGTYPSQNIVYCILYTGCVWRCHVYQTDPHTGSTLVPFNPSLVPARPGGGRNRDEGRT